MNVAVVWGCAVWSQVAGFPSELVLYEPDNISVDHAFHGFGVRIALVFSQGRDYRIDLRVASGWASCGHGAGFMANGIQCHTAEYTLPATEYPR